MLFRQGGSISKAVFQLRPVQSIQLQHYTHIHINSTHLILNAGAVAVNSVVFLGWKSIEIFAKFNTTS